MKPDAEVAEQSGDARVTGEGACGDGLCCVDGEFDVALTELGVGQSCGDDGAVAPHAGHPEFPSAQVMPLESADWLLKSAARIEATFDEPDSAADWYAEQLAQHAETFTGTYAPTADRDAFVRRLAAGEDAVGGWWLTGGRFLSLNLVACSPHRVRPEYACPAR
ncbi:MULTISPECIES: hypothetical protein [unclassified Streptomyces]|uniref:hypothetical protein n=1 Tax=unclassified Streptomyces TaxID=2593676 RepID=UPI00362F4BD0